MFKLLLDRGLVGPAAKDLVPGVLLGRGWADRLLDPLNRGGKTRMFLEGMDKIWPVKIGGLDVPEQEGLKDSVPVFTDTGALGEGRAAEEIGD